MIIGFFGVPGCGKTTLLTKFARNAIKAQKMNKFASKLRKKHVYDHIYTNFYCDGAEHIEFIDLNDNKIKNSLIILDELALDADNRQFKTFPQGIRDFLVLHRHLHNDIIYATQSYDAVDKKIKFLTQELWYMSRSVIPFLEEFTYAKRIYRNININEHTSELTMGYRFCNPLERFFVMNVQICYRKRYYRFFDSFEEGQLQGRPEFQSFKWGSEPPLKDEQLSSEDKMFL